MATASDDPTLASPVRYQAVSFWAVLSVVFAAASVAMFFVGWWASPSPLVAIYFGWKALEQIDRLPEEYTGRRLAQTGIWLGAGLGIVMSAWMIFVGNEVPHGYQVLEYADLEPDPNNKNEIVPAKAMELGDPEKKTRVYIRGYIEPGRRQVRLTEFNISRSNHWCPFQQKINRPTDLIHVELTGDLTIDYTTHLIGVGGVFHVDLENGHGTPYSVQADYLYNP